MANVRGYKTVLAGFTQDSFNTGPAAPNGERLYRRSNSLTGQMQRVVDETLSGFRGMTRSVAGNRTVTGAVPVTLAPESIGFWLKHLIGAPTTAGVNPYTHTFQVAASGANALPPSMLLELDLGDEILAANRYIRYTGCRINRGQFTFRPGALIDASFDIIGADFSNDAGAPLDATLIDPGHTAFEPAQITATIGALDVCLNELSLSCENGLDDSLYCLSNGGVRDDLPEGMFNATGSLSALVDNEDLMNQVLAGTDTDLVVTISRGDGLGSAGNESLVITYPSIVFDVVTPPVEGPRGVKLAANFMAHRTSAELAMSWVLKNARATFS